MLITVLTVSAAVPAQAAVKKGLVKSGGKYYYYNKKGEKTINKLKTLKQNGKKYVFYFGKNGAAFKAANSFDKTYNVKLFKIGKKQYGFDQYSHRVKPGIYVDSMSKIFVFNAKGVYDSKKSKTLRGKFKSVYDGGPKSKTLVDDIISVLGKPLKQEGGQKSCGGWDPDDSFTDMHLYYKYFEVQIFHNETTGEYGLNNFFSVIAK